MKLPRALSCTAASCGTGPRILGMLAMTASFMMVELVVGNWTNSMALVADSFHMLSDVIALVIAYISVRISPRKWRKNTYGYARAEVVGALINAVFLFALCFSIAVESFKRFLVLEPIADPQLIMIVGGVGLAINLFGMCLFGDVGHGHSHGGEGGHGHSHGGHGHGRQQEEGAGGGASMNVKGVFLHVMADALGSVVVLISAAVIWLTDWEYKDYLDPVLSLVIVVIICLSAWPLLRDSTLVLLNTIPPHIDLGRLQAELVTTVPGVSSIHELHVWRLVGRRVVASCHLEMFPPEKGEEPVAHHMTAAREVKEYFHKAGIHSTTIQLEYGSEMQSSGSCRLLCPGKEQELARDCIESSCCRERLGSRQPVEELDIGTQL